MLWIVFNFCYYAIFAIVPIIVFVFFSKDDNFHSTGGLLFFIKYIFGRGAVQKLKNKLRHSSKLLQENPTIITDDSQSDRTSFTATDKNGNQLSVKLTLRANHVAEVTLCLRINGQLYTLPSETTGVPTEHHVLTKSINKYQWKCQGLNIEILEPFKRYRLTFNGFLKHVTRKKPEMEHIKFNFIWGCYSKPNLAWLDDDLNLITTSLARTTWKNGQWLDLLGDENGYVQFGALKGQISGENLQETELNMVCARKRYWGSLESTMFDKQLTVFAATENGHLLQFGVKSVRDGCKEVKFGYLLVQGGTVYPIKNSDLDLNKIDQSISDKMTIHVEANKKIFKLVLSINKNSQIDFIKNSINGFKQQNISAECSVNSNNGMAIIEYWTSQKGNRIKKPTPLLKEISVENVPNIFVTTIGSEESKILQLTGGKGNSLALMKSLDSEELIIPDGFIVTTYAFQQQIHNNFHLKKAISLLNDIAVGKESGNLEDACKVTVELFKEHLITSSVSQGISDELMKFRKQHDDKIIPYLRWAVRSSAIGEDSEEFSSAGQNETFLGCQTDKDVLQKISQCWASLFAFQSVVYRRQHGLPIQTSMAVVVQKMVPAETAGVLFTCDPSNCNPAKMVITSNFGLGETVVSGDSEPDTIILSKTFDGTVSFDSYTVGSKDKALVMGRYGIHKSALTEDKSRELSLSKDHSLKLGKVGVLLEEAFGGPRDIEWAVFKDNIFILQSRPVTTLNQWTDYELLHELDSPHMSNNTFYTRANIGEVQPFAMTPLTQTAAMNGLEKGYQVRLFGNYNPYCTIAILCSHHFGMIDLLAGIYPKPRKVVDVSAVMVDLSIFGHCVLDDELNKKAIAKNGLQTLTETVKELTEVAKWLWQASYMLKKMETEIEGINIEISEKDGTVDIYKRIEEILDKFTYLSNLHCIITGISVIYQTFTMLTLMEGKKEISQEHFNDLTLILSSCEEVISAQVPKKLEEMAEVLKNSDLVEEFISIKPEDGVEWLKEHCQEVHLLLGQFLTEHGHRVLGEFEFSVDPWEKDPSSLIQMIQVNCKLGTMKRTEQDNQQDVIGKLESSTGRLTKPILRFLIKKQKEAVGNREKSKSALVKLINKLRNAYKGLAKKMVLEGLIPSENLVFHFTTYELWQVINRESPNLVSKALRRQRLHPIWNKLKFPEIMYDIPVPEPEEEPVLDISDSEVCCVGTPVCVGEITARACVITSLDEIKVLQKGDILITRSTDIGWSPYFPILSGIVTELGGLVSHGAVVAREYGLPCLVGTKGATRLFKTGDTVYLSVKSKSIKLISRE